MMLIVGGGLDLACCSTSAAAGFPPHRLHSKMVLTGTAVLILFGMLSS
jgi:hypothetical protein